MAVVSAISPAEAAQELLTRRAARKNLMPFVHLTFPTYRERPYHSAIANALDAVAQGSVKRLMIFLPPQHGKSELVSRRFPAWLLGRAPNTRIILTSYAAALAESHSREARSVMMQPEYSAVFGEKSRHEHPVKLSDNATAVSEWKLAEPHRGGMRAAGVGGGITGFGADLFIIDDPLRDDADALSEKTRESQKAWYSSVAETRLSPQAAVIICLTRWHEDDLAGWLLRLGDEHWDVVRIPAVAEGQAERDKFAEAHNLPIGDNDPLGREPGMALDPERHDEAKLAQVQARNPRIFASVWQQNPRALGGGFFKVNNLKFIDERPVGVRWVRAWDFAYTEKEAGKREPDFSAGVLAGWWRVAADDQRFVIADVQRGQFGWHDVKALVRRLAAVDSTGVPIFAEEKGNQKAAVSDLKTDPDLRGYSIRRSNLQGDKISLAQPLADRVEAGVVYLVRGDWNQAFIDEMEAFPSGRHDDQVDAASMSYHETAGPQEMRSATIVGFGAVNRRRGIG